MNTVERAAIGLYEHLAAMPGTRQAEVPWHHASEDLKNRLRDQARAMLETVSDRLMPEPKSTMLERAVGACDAALEITTRTNPVRIESGSTKAHIDTLPAVRAVIASLRDPDEDMLRAMGSAFALPHRSQIFNEIIDAILKEPS